MSKYRLILNENEADDSDYGPGKDSTVDEPQLPKFGDKKTYASKAAKEYATLKSQRHPDEEALVNTARELFKVGGGEQFYNQARSSGFSNKDIIKLTDAFGPAEIESGNNLLRFFKNNGDTFSSLFSDSDEGKKIKKDLLVKIYNKYVANNNDELFSKNYSNDNKHELKSELNYLLKGKKDSSNVEDDRIRDLIDKIKNIPSEDFGKLEKSINDIVDKKN